MSLQARVLRLLGAGILLGSCVDSPTSLEPVEPLIGATSVAVSLVESRSIPLDGLPRLAVSGTSGAVEITWELENLACLTGVATAQQAGSVLQIELRQSLNPGIICAVRVAGYRYVTRVTGLAPGHYEVRLIGVTGSNPAVLAGRLPAVVLP